LAILLKTVISVWMKTFAGLENINPKVRDFTRVADIISLNIKLVKAV